MSGDQGTKDGGGAIEIFVAGRPGRQPARPDLVDRATGGRRHQPTRSDDAHRAAGAAPVASNR